jgi:hypothetical protein
MPNSSQKALPIKIVKKILAESNSRCAICFGGDITILEIHHIEPRSDGGNNEPENLLAVCPNCHTKITKGIVSVFEVFRAKYQLKNANSIHAGSGAPSNVIQFTRSVNNGIFANNLTVKTAKRTVKLNPPEGTIASDLNKRNYLKYLIDRYGEFKKADKNVGDYRYGLIYGAIKKEFKCKWDYIPVHKFKEVVEYLHKRIDNTILGKVQRKRGQRRYRTFEEFMNGLE